MRKCNDHIVQLIQLALSGELNEEEQSELQEWCREKQEHQDFYDDICRDSRFSQEFPIYLQIDEERALRRLNQIFPGKSKPFVIWRRLARYAAILVLPFLGIIVWKLQQPVLEEVVSDVIVPGSLKAVLTLADGKQVNLEQNFQEEEIELTRGVHLEQSRGVLTYDSVEISQEQDEIEYNILSTGRGGEYRLVLADGTKVYLNAATTFRYPVAFQGDVRKVELDGEAYFEVSADSSRAFIVETREIEVKVYGTSFNINTQRMNEIQTVLEEGSVSVRALECDQEYRLKPGQLAEWNRKTGVVNLREVDVSLYTAWKNGVFRFNQDCLEDILLTLGNWYDVEIIYLDQHLKNLHFSGYMERYEQIHTILEAITEATGVKFSVQERTIIVSK